MRPVKAEVLLAVFERPPEATGDTINSAVVIASESAASYPGLKKAEDYLGPLTELATAKGSRPKANRMRWKWSRGNCCAPISSSRSVKTIDKLTMRQCTLVLLAKGQIVSFTFIAGSEDELDDLMDGLHFGAQIRTLGRRTATSPSKRASLLRLMRKIAHVPKQQQKPPFMLSIPASK